MLKARGYYPLQGARWYPEDIAGAIGKPVVGNIYYVDTTNGSDSDSGTSWDAALATFGKAEDLVVSGNHDVIVLAPGAAAASTESAAITFDKNHVTVIGNVAPTMFSQRARVLAAASVSPLLTISVYGNIFVNVQFASFQDNNALVSVTGTRNSFHNVHFAGMGIQAAADDTAAYSLLLDGGGENYFDHCVVGLDTVERGAQNRSLYLDGGTVRNVFEDCIFPAWVDATTPAFVEAADASAADRFTLFRRCEFISFSTNEATAMATAFRIPASPATHRYILTDCVAVDGAGTLDWDSSNRGDLFANMPAAAASAAGGVATSQ